MKTANPGRPIPPTPYPFILIEGEKLKVPAYGGDVRLREDGRLSDVAPDHSADS